MKRTKRVRQRGKIKLSEYFKELKDGDRVTVISELSVMPKFPKTLQGRSGKIAGKRGASYIVKLNDMNREKTYIIHPVHLRKLK